MTAGARATFLADQHDAAATAQRLQLLAFANANQLALDSVLTHPVARRFTERLLLWRLNRLVDDCEHLSPDAPQPTYWLPHEPRLLRCGDCLEQGARELVDRDEKPCAHCGQVPNPPLYAQLRVAVGSTQIVAMICGACAALGGAS